MFGLFSAEISLQEFELAALKLQPKTFWSSGSLEVRGTNGESKIFPEREFSVESIKWVENDEAPSVKISISGRMIICGEYDDECVRVYNVVVSGPAHKIKAIKRKLLEQQGYILV